MLSLSLITDLITETASQGQMGREHIHCGDAGQRDDSGPRQDGA